MFFCTHIKHTEKIINSLHTKISKLSGMAEEGQAKPQHIYSVQMHDQSMKLNKKFATRFITHSSFYDSHSPFDDLNTVFRIFP